MTMSKTFTHRAFSLALVAALVTGCSEGEISTSRGRSVPILFCLNRHQLSYLI